MCDPSTGLSRGYGFVRFGEESDMQRALLLGANSHSGLLLHGRTIRISEASGPGASANGLPGMPGLEGHGASYTQARREGGSRPAGLLPSVRERAGLAERLERTPIPRQPLRRLATDFALQRTSVRVIDFCTVRYHAESERAVPFKRCGGG